MFDGGRHFCGGRGRFAAVLGLGCLLAGGMAGCEYAPLEPLPSGTPTLVPPTFTERSPEEQAAHDARLAKLTAEVEEQLGVLPDALGGGTGGMRAGGGIGMGIGVTITEPGQHSVITACSPAGQATLNINPESGPVVSVVVHCGERAETPVQLEPGGVSVSLEPHGPELSVGAIFLTPPGASPVAEPTRQPEG